MEFFILVKLLIGLRMGLGYLILRFSLKMGFCYFSSPKDSLEASGGVTSDYQNRKGCKLKLPIERVLQNFIPPKIIKNSNFITLCSGRVVHKCKLIIVLHL